MDCSLSLERLEWQMRRGPARRNGRTVTISFLAKHNMRPVGATASVDTNPLIAVDRTVVIDGKIESNAFS
jgi:hypothetical protein